MKPIVKSTLCNLPIIIILIMFWVTDLVLDKTSGLTMTVLVINLVAFLLLLVQAGICLYFITKFLLKKFRK